MPDPEKEELKNKINEAKRILKAAEKDMNEGKTVNSREVITRTIGVLG